MNTMETDQDENDNTNVVSASPRYAKKTTTQREYPKVSRQVALQKEKENSKFMESFDPEKSAREQRKYTKKLQAPIGAVNDAAGVHIETNIDLCDCFEEACEGCFFPCPKCTSSKCGPECRQNRKTKYKMIEYHGFDYCKKFPLDDN